MGKDGLAEAFAKALSSEDVAEVIKLLKKVLLVPHYAEWIAPKLIQSHKNPAPRLAFNWHEPRNALAIAHLRTLGKEALFPPCMAVLESPRDPFLNLGSHPDVVERLWDEVGAQLPEEARAIVYGVPSLVAPDSGLLLAQAYGTQYILRIPLSEKAKALKAGAKTLMHWPAGRTSDLKQEYGDDWIFGFWSKEEPRWCVESSKK